MQKLKATLGRGYMFGFGVLLLTAGLTGLAMWNDQGKMTWYLDHWANFAQWLTITVLGAKGLEKIGTTFGKAQIEKHSNGGGTNGGGN